VITDAFILPREVEHPKFHLSPTLW
jgi:hypothetical protein